MANAGRRRSAPAFAFFDCTSVRWWPMTPYPRSRWTDFCYRLLAALCVLESLTSCASALSTGQISAQHDRTRGDAVLILDEAIHRLGDPSSDYRKVLLDAVAALPGNAQGEVSGEIHRFLSRIP